MWIFIIELKKKKNEQVLTLYRNMFYLDDPSTYYTRCVTTHANCFLVPTATQSNKFTTS